VTWKVYQEDIPYAGFTGYEAGLYVRRHNPAVLFDSVGLNETRVLNIVGGKDLLSATEIQQKRKYTNFHN
jgi:hypothetical protein